MRWRRQQLQPVPLQPAYVALTVDEDGILTVSPLALVQIVLDPDGLAGTVVQGAYLDPNDSHTGIFSEI